MCDDTLGAVGHSVIVAGFAAPHREMLRRQTVHHRQSISRRHKVHGLFTNSVFDLSLAAMPSHGVVMV